MRNMKKILMILLAVCMILSLCACASAGQGGNLDDNNGTEGSTATTGSTESTGSTEGSGEPDDGKVTYTVNVVDEAGNPVTGGMIQFCLDSCIPCMLDANGVASMRLALADYKVSFTMMPAGYALAGDKTEFYFADGSYELTITLKAAG